MVLSSRPNQGAGTNNVEEMLEHGKGPTKKGIGGTVSTMAEIIGSGEGLAGNGVTLGDGGGGGSSGPSSSEIAMHARNAQASMQK